MTSNPLQEAVIELYADIIYKNLKSLARSEDTSLKYLAMDIEKQKLTEEDMKKISLIMAKLLYKDIIKMKKNGELTKSMMDKIIKKHSAHALKEYLK